MARNADPHPEPNDPNEGPTPKFPPGSRTTRSWKRVARYASRAVVSQEEYTDRS